MSDISLRCNAKPDEHRERTFPQIYTDVPTQVSPEPGGIIRLETPANLFVTWTTRRLYNPKTEGTLAIRWANNGERYLESNDGQFVVDDLSYMIFNHGQEFSSYVESRTIVECSSVCFQPMLVESVLRDLVLPDDRLLDDPFPDFWQPVQFVERTYRHDAIVSPLLFRLQRMRDSPNATHGWFEEQFHSLLVAMLHVHRNVRREVELVPAARASTREELYRRLHRARDYMEAGLYQPLTLREIAEVAWFSPHHFLRLFKQVFHETPHQYLTRRRLERAQNLLLRTELSVTDICYTLGFESLGSFSWMFRRHLGVSPETFRMHKGNLNSAALQRQGESLARPEYDLILQTK